MRKIFSLLVVMFLMTNAFAYADQHMEVSFTFTGAEQNRTQSVDLYEQGGRMIATSTLIPEYAVNIGPNKFLTDYSPLFFLFPEKISDIRTALYSVISPWLEQILSVPAYDVYAGELFDQASAMRQAEFMLSDLTGYIRSVADGGIPAMDKHVTEYLSATAGLIDMLSGNTDYQIHFESYDNGRYVSAAVLTGSVVKMTISAELAGEKAKNILIAYREDGRNYYRTITVQNDGEGAEFESSLYSGEDTSFRNTSASRPMFTERINLSGDLYRFQLNADTLTDPLIVTGTAIRQEDGLGSMSLNVRIEGYDTDYIRISINTDTLRRPVSFTDKQVVMLENEKENAGVMIAASTNAMLLAAEIIPALPADYQKLILKWLYQ